MERSLNPRIEEKLKKNADDEIYFRFLLSLLREEFLNSDKAHWNFRQTYKNKIREYADKFYSHSREG